MTRNSLRRLALLSLIAALTLSTGTTPASADPTTGTIAGRITNADGSPAPSQTVAAIDADGRERGATSTDLGGYYTIAELPPGPYVVSVPRDAHRQFARGTTRYETADRFSVAAGQTTTVDEQLLELGSLRLTVTEYTGAPANATVSLIDASGNYIPGGQLDAAGQLTVTTFAGPYKVEVAPLKPEGYPDFFRRQWLHGKTSLELADRVDIAANTVTAVTEQLLAPGSITVAARDAGTGAALADFCVGAPGPACSGGTGTVTVSGLAPGTWPVSVYTEDRRYFGNTVDVAVTSGQTTQTTVALRRGATVTTTIVDAVTGAPVGGACATTVDTRRTSIPEASDGCSDPDGRLVIGPLEPSAYRLFMLPPTGSGYGAQWVGVHGGTGIPEKARVLTAAAGANLTLPPIRFDRAGVVTGVVTSETGGAVRSGHVSIHAWGLGVGPSHSANTDENGRYTIDWLGPYEWPLLFDDNGRHARQWSGSTADRRTAKQIKVRPGRTTTYDLRMKVGTVLAGTFTHPNGQPFIGDLTAVHAGSAETLARGDAPPGTYRMLILGGTSVKLTWFERDTGRTAWYDDDADFDHARKVFVPKHGTKTVNITVPN